MQTLGLTDSSAQDSVCGWPPQLTFLCGQPDSTHATQMVFLWHKVNEQIPPRLHVFLTPTNLSTASSPTLSLMTGRSGPKSLYKSDEQAWLDSAINEYLVLDRDRPTDAAKLKEKKTEEFLELFQTQLVDASRNLEKSPVTEIDLWRTVSNTFRQFAENSTCWNQRIKALFKNMKHRKLQKVSATVEDLGDFNPLRAFQASNTLTGRDLYREATRASITAQATSDREASGDPPSKQIGYFQSAEKRAWEALSDSDKKKWDKDALPQEKSQEESYTSPHILR